MPKITYFTTHSGDHSIGIQPEYYTPVYYYPAIAISTQSMLVLYPVVESYSSIDPILKHGLFKPPSVEQRMALTSYNTSHYRPSKDVKKLITSVPNVPALEMMAEEIDEMEKMGIAFK